MHIEELEELMAMHPEVESGCKELSKNNRKHLLLSGLHASARSMLLAAIQRKIGQSVLVVMDNADEAQYMYSDLNTINLPDETGAKVLFFPVSKRRRQGVDEALAIQRTETLSQLTINIQSGKESTQCTMVVTYPEAIMECVPAPKALEYNTLYLKAGEEIQQSRLTEKLGELGFERVDFVYEPGQYAVRGGIVDVYSYSHDDPFRLDFFGDEIDSIRKFDIETQLSKDKVQQIDIVGVTSGKEHGKHYTLLCIYALFAPCIGVEPVGDIELFGFEIAERGVLIDLLHVEGIDRQCHRGTLSFGEVVEVDSTVFAAHPYTAHERWGEAHKPTVGVVVGSTRFATHRGFDTIFIAHAHARTMIHHVAEHINHFVGSTFADDFVRIRYKRGNDIAVVVLYSCYVERFGANTLVGKGGISVHHFLYAHLARSETETDDRIKLPLDTKRLH